MSFDKQNTFVLKSFVVLKEVLLKNINKQMKVNKIKYPFKKTT